MLTGPIDIKHILDQPAEGIFNPSHMKSLIIPVVLLVLTVATAYQIIIRPAVHKQHVIMSEDIGAAKVGDSLSIYTKNDTTHIVYYQDHPHGIPYILSGN